MKQYQDGTVVQTPYVSEIREIAKSIYYIITELYHFQKNSSGFIALLIQRDKLSFECLKEFESIPWTLESLSIQLRHMQVQTMKQEDLGRIKQSNLTSMPHSMMKELIEKMQKAINVFDCSDKEKSNEQLEKIKKQVKSLFKSNASKNLKLAFEIHKQLILMQSKIRHSNPIIKVYMIFNEIRTRHLRQYYKYPATLIEKKTKELIQNQLHTQTCVSNANGESASHNYSTKSDLELALKKKQQKIQMILDNLIEDWYQPIITALTSEVAHQIDVIANASTSINKVKALFSGLQAKGARTDFEKRDQSQAQLWCHCVQRLLTLKKSLLTNTTNSTVNASVSGSQTVSSRCYESPIGSSREILKQIPLRNPRLSIISNETIGAHVSLNRTK